MPRNATSGAGPHDVTMPQLGMAQDAGKIVAWLKAAGDPVAKGDALFEVETDKATMEVEAQANGFLTAITAAEGEDVPVGAVIARISDSAEEDTPASKAASQDAPAVGSHADDALPEGRSVTMPQLGMAQDSGLLVSWQKSLGDAVSADDILFEVETDKSTVEVPAGMGGYLAATLAEAGDEVPVGAPVAVISADAPAKTLSRGVGGADTPAVTPPASPPAPAPQATAKPAPRPAPLPASKGRILASPKARRVALERGLDLNALVAAGHPQPFHMRDLEVLADLPAATASTTAAAAAPIRLTAEISTDGLAAFTQWAATAHGLMDRDAILAGMAGASLSQPGIIAIERHGQSRGFAIPPDRALSAITRSDDGPDLILRDLRDTAMRSVAAGAEACPVLTLMSGHAGLIITLECSAEQMPAPAAIALLSAFAGRMEQPLRHLL